MSRELFEDGASSRYDEMLKDFTNLAINRFTWDNLPIGLTSERLEEMLINSGQLMTFKRNGGGITILPCYGLSDINVYGLANNYMVTGYNGYTETIDIDDGVLIKNNPLATPNMSTLQLFAKRLDDTEMTQDVNLFQQNIPKIILADENGQLTAKNLIDKIRKFKFVIFGKKTLSATIQQGEVLDTSAPYLLDKLQEHKTSLYNDVMTYLGINNNNVNKKERLVVDEVNANNDLITSNLDLMYDMRKKACDEINSKFGLNITVEKKEVKESGELYNDDKGNNK